MRSFILAAFACTLSLTTIAQTKVPVDSVSKYIGQQVTVCTKVYGVKSLEKLTFINAGAAYPKSPLTIVILAKDLPNFKDSPATLYDNKQICVTGKVEDFKGKAEIVITKPEEIIVQ